VDKRTRIEADVINNEVYALKNIPVVAVVYDNNGNAHEASATVIDYISPNDQTHISFTWNEAFNFSVSKIDIVPKLVPRDWSR
jgi:hypothetical protein